MDQSIDTVQTERKIVLLNMLTIFLSSSSIVNEIYFVNLKLLISYNQGSEF